MRHLSFINPLRKIGMSVFFFILLAFAFPPILQAAETIHSLEVVGNVKTDSETLLKNVQSTVGSSFSKDRIHEDIKRLYQMGIFSEIQVEKENQAGGLKLLIRVREKPDVGRIVIQGAKEVSESKVRDEIVQKPFQILDENKIAESKAKIKELYAKEGMGFALITSEVEPSKTQKNEVDLVFQITENKASKIEKVTFEGNKAFSSRKLQGFLKSKPKGILSFLTGSGKYRDEMIDRDVAFLTYQYLNQGYLKAQVERPEVIPMPSGKGIELRFRIHEGQKYRVNQITVAGDVLTTSEEILSHFENLKGNYFSQKVLEEDLLGVEEMYGNQGYAFANIRPRPFPDDAKKEVDIEINIDKGQKTIIEKINITGNTVTRDKVIRRELMVKENSLYNETLLRKSKARVEALGFFESVEFATPKGSAEDRLVLNIHVKEKSTGSFSVGAGFSSVESFLFTASVSKQNFLGLGISGSLLAELSKKRQQFSLQFTDPYFLDTRWILNGEFSKILVHYDDFDRDSIGGELDLGHHLFEHSSFSLGYRFEDVKVDSFSVIVPEFFKKDASGITSSLVANAQRDTRNNRLFATKGSFNQVSLEYAGLGGDNDFLRVDGSSRWYIPVPLPKNSAIKANARIGYIKSLNDRPVPLFERYFTGGINSLRGFQPRTIGPSLQIPSSSTGADETFVFGGNKLLLFNLEYEFPLYDAAGFRGVIFADAGNAFGEDENFNLLKLRANYGFGLRWISPFGPLRFEWGLPFKRKPGEEKMVFNFTIGSLF